MRQKCMIQSKASAPALTSPAAGAAGFAALDKANSLGKSGLRRLLAWQLVRSAVRIGSAGSLALLFGALIMGESVTPALVVAVAALVAAAALASLMADRCQALAETSVSKALRVALRERLQAMPAGLQRKLSPGSAAVAIQRHPEAIAALVVGHRAATMMMAAGPLLAAAALALVSWQAALLVLGLTPVMILFFALVGGAIRQSARAQEQAFGHLAAQFADRVRTLPTIVGNDAVAREQAKLAERLDVYVGRTMGVLRLAFLNAGLIDFFAALSIAMLAVFLGLGHLGLATIPGFSHLALWQSLFILMIAPEYFGHFRRFSEQYHAKAEGLAAAAGLDDLLDITADPPVLPAVDHALAELADLPPHGLVVISGSSGTGKSTLLRRIVGIEEGAANGAVIPAGSCAWIGMDSFVPGATLEEAIGEGLGDQAIARVSEVAGRIGLLDDELLRGGLAAPIGPGGVALSGGQRLRIAVARALLGTGTVIADEPTAKLDPATARSVRQGLREIASSRLVIAASHDPALIALADRHLALSPAGVTELAA
ncbi:ATP-binding cassette, subfamily C [Bosea sp. TND4EK4]|nr:ATP-binding cassette, subfamily C [Bosea sp. TND4EK4]